MGGRLDPAAPGQHQEQDNAMTEKTPSTYAALPLQVTCRAVNAAGSTEEARAAMLDAVCHCTDLIGGSKRFYSTFAGEEIRLVVLPEYFMTSFPAGESVVEWQEKACIHPSGPEYEALGRVAQEQALFLSGNAYEIDPHFPELYFQVSFLIDPAGDVVLRYRRLISMFAPTPHDVLDAFLDHYGEDALFPVADTELGRVACVASEEILYPEIARALALRGAEVFCHSSSEVGSPLATPKNIAKQARAWENMAYIVSANSAGITGLPFPAQSTDGHSQVVDYKGRLLAEANAGESMNGVATIDIAGLRRARALPAMSNPLARQRLELFSSTYSGRSVYPPNTLLEEGVTRVPARDHYTGVQQAVVESLRERGLI